MAKRQRRRVVETYVPESVYEQLQAHAEEMGLSLSAATCQVIKNQLNWMAYDKLRRYTKGKGLTKPKKTTAKAKESSIQRAASNMAKRWLNESTEDR